MRFAKFLINVRQGDKIVKDFTILAHRGYIWEFDMDIENDNQKLISYLFDKFRLDDIGIGAKGASANLIELFKFINAYRHDILIGKIIQGTRICIDTHISKHNNLLQKIRQSPYTSTVIKNIVDCYSLDGVETLDFDYSLEQVATVELKSNKFTKVFIPQSEILGDIPIVLYHGTNSKYIRSILSKGIMFTTHTNSQMIFNDTIFLSVNPNTASFYTKIQAQKFNSLPIIIKTKIPDHNKIVLDFDIAATYYGIDNQETINLNYVDQYTYIDEKYENNIKKFREFNKGTDFSKQMGVFGYKGRIPASLFTNIIMPISVDWEEDSNWRDWHNFTDMNEVKTALNMIDEFGYYDPDYDQELKVMNENF